jgi:hypothetical protein
MNPIERFKRWWAPGEYDDQRGVSEGEGFALPDEAYEAERPTAELVHSRSQRVDPRTERD